MFVAAELECERFMPRFDFSQMIIILEHIAQRTNITRMMMAFFSICLASIALRAFARSDIAFSRLPSGKLFALLIIVLFIFTKRAKTIRPAASDPIAGTIVFCCAA